MMRFSASWNVSSPAEHSPIVSLTNRARVAWRDRDRSALRFLQRSPQDSRKALHADDHGFHRHGRAAYDHSAAAVLWEGVKRLRLDCAAFSYRRRNHHRLHRYFLHGGATLKRAAVEKVFRSSWPPSDPADCLSSIGNCLSYFWLCPFAAVVIHLAPRAGRRRRHRRSYSSLCRRLHRAERSHACFGLAVGHDESWRGNWTRHRIVRRYLRHEQGTHEPVGYRDRPRGAGDFRRRALSYQHHFRGPLFNRVTRL